MSTPDDLRAAADYIRDHGWCQKAALDGEGRVCAMGALAAVTGTELDESGIGEVTDEYCSATTEFQRWLNTNIQGSLHIAGWNDEPTRVADDVITGLDKAAAWLEEQA